MIWIPHLIKRKIRFNLIFLSAWSPAHLPRKLTTLKGGGEPMVNPTSNSLITKQNKKDFKRAYFLGNLSPQISSWNFRNPAPSFESIKVEKKDGVGDEDGKEKPGAMLVSTLQPIHYRKLNSLFLPPTPHSRSAAPMCIIRYVPGWVLPAQSKANQAEPYNLLHQTKITPTNLKNLASFRLTAAPLWQGSVNVGDLWHVAEI